MREPIIDFGKLSEPATKLIEIIGKAIGVLYEPTKKKRLAKAEREIEKLDLFHKIELEEIQRRAIQRFIHSETEKQINIEQIASKAIPQLNGSSRPEEINKSWLTYFIENSKYTSDEQIQELWGMILAGEANNPGKFSKRTISVLSTMDKSEAEMFIKLSSFVWTIGSNIQPIIMEYRNPFYELQNINFDMLYHLDSVGLIKLYSGGLGGFAIQYLEDFIIGNYCGNKYKFTPMNNENKHLDCGDVLFTKVGEELFSIMNQNKLDYFEDYILPEWRKRGCHIEKLN